MRNRPCRCHPATRSDAVHLRPVFPRWKRRIEDRFIGECRYLWRIGHRAENVVVHSHRTEDLLMDILDITLIVLLFLGQMLYHSLEDREIGVGINAELPRNNWILAEIDRKSTRL